MMDDFREYKLIHAVDPTKIKLPIRERFAKLTLSSNKKKKDIDQEQQHQHNKDQMEKRQSVRNLSEFFDECDGNQNESGEENENTRKNTNFINPLLRSDSSSSQLAETQLNTMAENSADIYGQQSQYTMDPLQLSDDEEENEVKNQPVVAALSQQFNLLSVGSKAITISSTTTEQQMLELTQMVSMESQRPTKEKELMVAPVFPQNSICISSTEAEDSDDEIEDEIIILDSDTDSVSGRPNVAADYEMMTSNIPLTGETDDAFLPSTFSNEKANRMEAFLRDVSQERRENRRLQQQDTIETSSTESQLYGDATEMSALQIKQELDCSNSKAKQLATADTESMSPVDSEMDHYSARENRLHALDETTAMSQTHSSLFNLESDKRRESSVIFPQQSNAANRLANDETEANTLNTFTEMINNSNDSVSPTKQNDTHTTLSSSTNSAPPEDSITISETASENEEELQPSVQTPISKELVASEQTHATSSDDDDDGSPMQIQMGSINISAKINIKIHFSQQLDSDESETHSSADDGDNDDELRKRTPSLSTTENQSTVKSVQQLQRSASPENQSSDKSVHQLQGSPSPTKSPDPTDDNFMSHAEQLLTQLYGKTWQTPQVIRALKRTSGSGGKKNTVSTPTTSTKKPIDNTPLKNHINEDKSPIARQAAKVVEESMLDDFSIFRRNIVKTNLDSTRLVTPKQRKTKPPIDSTNSEPRRTTKVTSSSKREDEVFKIPQTEVKKRIVKTQRGRVVKERWRQIVDKDTDSEGDNASDDPDADISGYRSSDCDNSWSKDKAATVNSSDSDLESTKKIRTRGKVSKPNSKNKLIYLDLSKNEIEVQEGTPAEAPANNDANFNTRLQDILRTCKREERPKLEATPKSTKPKRKLFTANFGDEDIETCAQPSPRTPKPILNIDDDLVQDLENVPFNSNLMPAIFGGLFNKQLEAIKSGKPIFKVTPPRLKEKPDQIGTPTAKSLNNTPDVESPKSSSKTNRKNDEVVVTHKNKYGFLKSLDACVSKSLCHPDALYYRDNYRLKKEDLSRILFDLYNEKLFNNGLQVPLVWNKKLSNTAGRCLNKKKFGNRSSTVELSEKVLTSADRLRCTLVHELCHAATWIFNGEGGHGSTWKSWARKANSIFPELPKIGVCHQYDIEYKYTYKCTLCDAKSHAHSKSKKVENIRCSYCHGAIEIYLNKKNKEGNIIPTPVREPTGFAKFVKDNYKQYKRNDLKHADVMKLLSNEFAALKVAGNAN